MRLSQGTLVRLSEETDYPRDGKIRLHVDPETPSTFAIKLRIPSWSPSSRVTVNGADAGPVKPGSYLRLSRNWKAGDKVEIGLNFSFHYWAGERECRDRVSIYRGPILLTYDRQFNEMDPADLPTLDARGLSARLVDRAGRHKPYMLMEFDAVDGRKLRLCDFASAGNGGSPYLSWLLVRHVTPTEFSPTNPLRSSRAVTAQ